MLANNDDEKYFENLPPYKKMTKLDWIYDGATLFIHTIDVLTGNLVTYIWKCFLL